MLSTSVLSLATIQIGTGPSIVFDVLKKLTDFPVLEHIHIVGHLTAPILSDLLPQLRNKSNRLLSFTNVRSWTETGLSPLRVFCEDHPEWSVVELADRLPEFNPQTITFSCRASDKPELPSTIKMGISFSKAVGRYVWNAMTDQDLYTSPEQYRTRLSTCMLCPKRSGKSGDQCSLCGCYLVEKAKLLSEQCPIGKWSERHAESLSTIEIELTKSKPIGMPAGGISEQTVGRCGGCGGGRKSGQLKPT